MGAGDATATATASSDAGSLPFTGYPLTDAVLIAMLLLGGGLALRLSLAGYQRLRPDA